MNDLPQDSEDTAAGGLSDDHQRTQPGELQDGPPKVALGHTMPEVGRVPVLAPSLQGLASQGGAAPLHTGAGHGVLRLCRGGGLFDGGR
ncbi:hypothetical protein [Ideonella paludis]|uniref:hypothetical protein n=1 Tax=Ideonella paludis TaxID=1233411 RepID=UPI00363300B3